MQIRPSTSTTFTRATRRPLFKTAPPDLDYVNLINICRYLHLTDTSLRSSYPAGVTPGLWLVTAKVSNRWDLIDGRKRVYFLKKLIVELVV